MANIVLSIVSPVYKAEFTVGELVRRIDAAAAKVTDQYEIILIEDRGPDNSWQRIRDAASTNRHVRGVRLSRNFGQHEAITAGLCQARGQYVVVIDCDLQQNPEEIPVLYSKLMEGYDVVIALHPKRQHSRMRNMGASSFRWLNTLFSGRKQLSTNLSGYSIITRKVVDAFLQFPEAGRHYLQILAWMGFSVGYVNVPHHERYEGKSSYSIFTLIRHAIRGTIGNSKKLLYLSIGLGFAYFTAAAIGIIYVILQYTLWGLKEGWASVVVLLLVSTGFILLTLGIVGIYIGSIYEQVRGRPLYIIDKTTEDNDLV